MVKEFKEHWKVAIITGFVTMVFTLIGYYIVSKSTKINDSATIEYVDKKHYESITYTDKEIDKHSKIEDAKRQGMQTQIDEIGRQTSVIYNWVLNQQKTK